VCKSTFLLPVWAELFLFCPATTGRICRFFFIRRQRYARLRLCKYGFSSHYLFIFSAKIQIFFDMMLLFFFAQSVAVGLGYIVLAAPP